MRQVARPQSLPKVILCRVGNASADLMYVSELDSSQEF